MSGRKAMETSWINFLEKWNNNNSKTMYLNEDRDDVAFLTGSGSSKFFFISSGTVPLRIWFLWYPELDQNVDLDPY